MASCRSETRARGAFGVTLQSCSSLLHNCSRARPSVLCLPRTSQGKEKKVSLFRLFHSARLPRRGLRALPYGAATPAAAATPEEMRIRVLLAVDAGRHLDLRRASELDKAFDG